MRPSALAALLLMGAVSPVLSQATVQGIVTAGRGRPVVGTEVLIEALRISATTDRAGAFTLNVPPGHRVLTVRAIGYEATFIPVMASEAEPIDIEIELRARPQILDSVTTTVAGPPAVRGKMAAFEERRKEGIGQFITREKLAERENALLSDALRMTGIPLVRRPAGCGGGFAAGTNRGIGSMRGDKARCMGQMADGCYMSVYLDGMRIWVDGGTDPLNIDKFSPRELEAVEVYRGAGQAPVQYMGIDNACGVVLLWTRER